MYQGAIRVPGRKEAPRSQEAPSGRESTKWLGALSKWQESAKASTKMLIQRALGARRELSGN